MRIIKGNFGECRFCDCIEGMKELEEKSFDLCLTDYPYNVKFKGKAYGGKVYEDNKEKMEYIDWCKEVFEEIQRNTKFQSIFCGNPNIPYWCKYIKFPKDIAIWYKINCQSRGVGYYLPKHDSILLYGDLRHNKLSVSVIEQMVCYEQVRNHPCPSNPDLYERIIREMKPESVLDPFLGSGTTAEACESLGIKWLGFEIMEEYAPDIEKRIKKGQNKFESKDILHDFMDKNGWLK